MAIVAAVVGVALVVRSAVGSWFTSDDLVFLGEATEMPLGRSFLTEPIYDHFSPWHRGLDAVVVLRLPLDWAVPTAITVVLVVVVLGLAWAVLGRLTSGPVRVVGFALLALSPIFQ